MPNYFSAVTSSWSGREAQNDKRRFIHSKSFGAAPKSTREAQGHGPLHSLAHALMLPPCPRPLDFACRLQLPLHTQLRGPLAAPRNGIEQEDLVPSRDSELKATATPKAPMARHATAPTDLDTHSPRPLATLARTLSAQVRRTVHAESPAATTKTNRPRRDLPL